jgi:hypothetical protein
VLLPALEQRGLALRQFAHALDLFYTQAIGEQALDVVDRGASVHLVCDAVDTVGDGFLARSLIAHAAAKFT